MDFNNINGFDQLKTMNNHFKSDLRKFMNDNNIVGTISGVAIALYTKDLISSFSGDVIMPSIYNLFKSLNVNWFISIFPHKIKFNVLGFSRNFITWVLGVLITYIFIQFAFKYLLGVSQTTENKEETKNDQKPGQK